MKIDVPESVTLGLISTVLILTLSLALVTGFFVALIERKEDNYWILACKNFIFLLSFSFPIGLVAYISGYLASIGRSSGIAQLLPAVLALMGALNIYVFGADNKYRFSISYCICIFAVMLLYGTQFGAFKRNVEQEFRLKELIAVETRLKTTRRNLKIGDDFPAWITGGEPK